MKKSPPRIAVLLLFLFSCLSIYPADLDGDFSKGPLFGKNMYVPFLIHYNFPSMPARSGGRAEFQYHLSLYYIQDEHYWAKNEPDFTTRSYDKENILRDYESWVAELGFAYNIFSNLQAGVDMRVMAYYGGFLDAFLESFHNTFGFVSGGREFFLRDQIYINIPNDNGITLFLDEETVSFGDIDLWGKWTFFETRRVSLAGLGAFKLPTGRLRKLSGSGYPDIGLGLLSDFRVARFFSLYTQAGFVLPFNMKSIPMLNGLVGFEIHPWDVLSFNAQMNIKSSPITDNTIPWSWNEIYFTDFMQYPMPQTNLLFGFIVRHKGLKFQVYLEEDFITNQGTDITFNMMFLQSLNLLKN
jgi:hypothetical protein